jgi:hypothetical protein
MRVFLNEKVHQKSLLIDYLFGNGKNEKNNVNSKEKKYDRDTVTISMEAKELSIKDANVDSCRNTNIDKSIDLKSYIDAVKKENDNAIENAGTSIDGAGVELKTYKDAVHAALTDKYERLVQEAKRHSDPAAYIQQKYFDKSSPYYQSDLSDAERSAGYNNEMDMLKMGKLSHTYYQDSLLRGCSFGAYQNEEYQLSRRMVNKQVENIFKEADIDLSFLTDKCIFYIDPYTYHISVDGADKEIKEKIEDALNVGDNGKELFLHIYKATQQEKCESNQIDRISNLKYQANAAIHEYTGLNLYEMSQRDGTFYTKDGKDIRLQLKQDIEKNIKDNKYNALEYVNHLLNEVGNIDWKNTGDMTLGISYTPTGLMDIGQNIIFDGYSKLDGTNWYSVL